MPFQFTRSTHSIADESIGTTLKALSTGIGMGMRMVFSYRDPDASFYFFAKPYEGDEGFGWQLKDAWSLDGITREEDRVRLGPITLSSDLTARAFRRIVEALPEYPLPDPKEPGVPKRLKDVRFDIHGLRTHNSLIGR